MVKHGTNFKLPMLMVPTVTIHGARVLLEKLLFAVSKSYNAPPFR
jgi:hypothetical protein